MHSNIPHPDYPKRKENPFAHNALRTFVTQLVSSLWSKFNNILYALKGSLCSSMRVCFNQYLIQWTLALMWIGNLPTSPYTRSLGFSCPHLNHVSIQTNVHYQSPKSYFPDPKSLLHREQSVSPEHQKSSKPINRGAVNLILFTHDALQHLSCSTYRILTRMVKAKPCRKMYTKILIRAQHFHHTIVSKFLIVITFLQ